MGITLPSARFLLILTSIALMPVAAGNPEETRMTGEDNCNVGFTTVQTPIGCRLSATATIQVSGCDERNCTFAAASFARGSAETPGYLAVDVLANVASGTSTGICLGPREVNDALSLPCKRICSSHNIGTETTCDGTRNITATLPRGNCTFASVLASFGYGIKAGSATVSHGWHVCRTNNDGILITALG